MKKIFKYLNIEISPAKQGGFTLVETLVAVSIFSVSILGLLSVLADGVADSSYAKQKLIAAYLAQEGIEYVRNMRDTSVLYSGGGNWNSFRNTPNINYPVAADFTGFIREVWLDKNGLGPDQVKIYSKVSWVQGSGTHDITFRADLFNWVE
ncbi:prepilin-type N-terminal cleavage/methylation domain-containing protein [Candidatus Nomurabacteria bacterium]|nr:prepilin-type N-terminal cleavage/methylation domain-containing protein [Candidatus Nomurabacteria bacterium]